jgi:hypothetical protein
VPPLTDLPHGALRPWLLERRGEWRAYLDEERSRSVHEEFLLAESGMLPDPGERLERLRTTLARAWLRHIARGLAAVWPGAPQDLPGRMDTWILSGGERLEALTLDERQRLERRGLSGDPDADRREVDLIAFARFFGEGLGEAMGDDGPGGPVIGVTVAERMRAGGLADVGDDPVAPDGVPVEQAREMEGVWRAAQELIAALEQVLGPRGG